MGRDLNPQCKRCRRAGEKLFLKGDRCLTPKCAMVRKPYPPGMHGKNPSKGTSEYGKQLAAKQKMKRIYGLMEKQFRHHFEEIRRKKGVTGDLLIARLEMRLDNVIYRSGLAASRVQARQLVRHGFFRVNRRKVNIPSYELKVGDVVDIAENKKSRNYISSQVLLVKNKKDFPSWIQLDKEKLQIKISGLPSREEAVGNIDPQLIVEFYSR